VVNNRFLTRRFGMMRLLVEIDFVCHRCRSRRYRLRFVPNHLGEIAPLGMQWFRGIYEKSLD
jgi:hypothetical protein